VDRNGSGSCPIAGFGKRDVDFLFLLPASWLFAFFLGTSVSTATGYGLDDQIIGVRYPVGTVIFSLLHRVQIVSGAHPGSYLMGTGASSLGCKVTEAWSWPLTSI